MADNEKLLVRIDLDLLKKVIDNQGICLCSFERKCPCEELLKLTSFKQSCHCGVFVKVG